MVPYIKIVTQFERLAVFTLGKFDELTGMRGPGVRFLIWPFQRSVTIDLREDVIDIPRQTNITKDNAPINIDFLVYMRVLEHTAHKVVLEVVNPVQAVVGMATTTLRAVIGEMNIDDVLSQREKINHELRIKLDDVTARWGINVTQISRLQRVKKDRQFYVQRAIGRLRFFVQREINRHPSYAQRASV